jgi:hypothetical protein
LVHPTPGLQINRMSDVDRTSVACFRNWSCGPDCPSPQKASAQGITHRPLLCLFFLSDGPIDEKTLATHGPTSDSAVSGHKGQRSSSVTSVTWPIIGGMIALCVLLLIAGKSCLLIV